MAQVAFEEIDAWNADARQMVDLLLGIPVNQLDEVAVGEWSARQILTHMLDSELVFSIRLRAAIAAPGRPVSPYDPDAMATQIPYQSVSLEHIGQAFLALRASNTEILKALPESVWEQGIAHPEYGPQPLPAVVRIFGEHIGNHMADLRAAQAQGG
jgi:DinB superfamily